MSLYDRSNDSKADSAVLRRLVEKLQLAQISDLTQESLALHEMVAATDGDPEERIEKMSKVLKKIKDFVLTENPDIDSSAQENPNPSSDSGQVSTLEGNQKTTVIPDDFRCPISLELMGDPVIVSTGQVLELVSFSLVQHFRINSALCWLCARQIMCFWKVISITAFLLHGKETVFCMSIVCSMA